MRRILIPAMLVALAACGATPRTAAVGEALPPISAPTIQGGAHRIDPAATGRPVLIDLWSATCLTCNEEAPAVRSLEARWRGRVDVVGVAVDERTDGPRAFIARHGVTWPVLEDGSLAIAKAVGVEYTPAYVLVGADGRVLHRAERLDQGLLDAVARAGGSR